MTDPEVVAKKILYDVGGSRFCDARPECNYSLLVDEPCDKCFVTVSHKILIDLITEALKHAYEQGVREIMKTKNVLIVGKGWNKKYKIDDHSEPAVDEFGNLVIMVEQDGESDSDGLD